MQSSDDVGEIAAALAKAQRNIRNPTKTKLNPHFKAKYADLATGLECVRGPLSEAGIALVQAPEIRGDVLVLHTRIVHAGSGQWIGSVYPVAPCGLPHQQLASAMTYARRQSLFALIEIAGDSDDQDGEDIGEFKNSHGILGLTPEHMTDLEGLIISNHASKAKFLKLFGATSVAEIPEKRYREAVALIQEAGQEHTRREATRGTPS